MLTNTRYNTICPGYSVFDPASISLHIHPVDSRSAWGNPDMNPLTIAVISDADEESLVMSSFINFLHTAF